MAYDFLNTQKLQIPTIEIHHKSNIYCEGGHFYSQYQEIDIRITDHDKKQAKEKMQYVVMAVNNFQQVVDALSNFVQSTEILAEDDAPISEEKARIYKSIKNSLTFETAKKALDKLTQPVGVK